MTLTGLRLEEQLQVILQLEAIFRLRLELDRSQPDLQLKEQLELCLRL